MAIKPLSANSLSALISQKAIGKSSAKLGENLAKMASGRGINKAADNAAGLAIVEQLEADVRSANQAQRNISDGAALTRVAEGGMSEISDLLSRGRELSVQAANGTLNDTQRQTLNTEIQSIKSEIDRISNVSEFNGQKVLDGSLAPGSSNQVSVQAGIQNTADDRISLNEINSTSSADLGVDNVDISTQQGAQNALADFDSAIADVNSSRAQIGALQNRLDSAAQNLAVSSENLTAAKSQIQDLDYAAESSDLSRNQVLTQAGVSTLQQGLSNQSSLLGSLLNIRG